MPAPARQGRCSEGLRHDGSRAGASPSPSCPTPARTEIAVAVGGRTVIADLATKSVRKAVKTLTENGADKVILIIQGALASNNRIEEAGITAQVKIAAGQAAAA
jgi:hypothetical protein